MKKEQKIFIVEGPDHSGKTTLCKKLAEAFHIPYIHLEYNPNLNELSRAFKEVMHKMDVGQSMVLDRFILSHLIYAAVFQDGKVMNDIENMVEYLGHDNSNLIICLPNDKEQWIKDFNGMIDRELYSDNDKMRQVYDLFKHYALILSKGCFIPNLSIYDYTKEND